MYQYYSPIPLNVYRSGFKPLGSGRYFKTFKIHAQNNQTQDKHSWYSLSYAGTKRATRHAQWVGNVNHLSVRADNTSVHMSALDGAADLSKIKQSLDIGEPTRTSPTEQFLNENVTHPANVLTGSYNIKSVGS